RVEPLLAQPAAREAERVERHLLGTHRSRPGRGLARQPRHFDPLARPPEGNFLRSAQLAFGDAKELGQTPAVYLLQLPRAALGNILLKVSGIAPEHAG